MCVSTSVCPESNCVCPCDNMSRCVCEVHVCLCVFVCVCYALSVFHKIMCVEESVCHAVCVCFYSVCVNVCAKCDIHSAAMLAQHVNVCECCVCVCVYVCLYMCLGVHPPSVCVYTLTHYLCVSACLCVCVCCPHTPCLAV